MAKKLKIQINFNIGKFKKGDQMIIDVDDHDIPLDKFWRKRLKDSEIDHCIEIINQSEPDKKSEKPMEK